MKQELTTTHKDAILSLLDDPSPIVKDAVSKELLRMGDSGITMLKEVISDNESLGLHAKSWLKSLGVEDSIDIFMDFIHSYNYELETGSLLMDRTVFPRLDISEYYQFMADISSRCRELMLLPSSAHERCKVINRVMFHEYAFRGNVENYYNPLNSYIHQVVKRRRGIPISLSILYILIAERCDLQLEPIALPSHFMVGCFADKEAFYVDPFHGGTFRTIKDVQDMVIAKTSQLSDHYLRPTSIGEVLCRCCRNLSNQYKLEQNMEQSELFSDFVKSFEKTYYKNARPQ